MMRLGQKQAIFSKNVGLLLHWLTINGQEFRIKEVQRPQVTADYYAKIGKGSKNSLHRDSLAIDIDFFKHGSYLRSMKAYEEAGRFWASLGMVWGGVFKRQDARHFEWGEK